MMSIFYVFIGGGLGSITRYGFGYITKRLFDFSFPLGTFLANIISCLIVGIVLYLFKEKLHHNSLIQPLILVGFCGGLSTFSTFSNETAQLIHNGNWIWAFLNIFISIIAGIAIIYWMRYQV